MKFIDYLKDRLAYIIIYFFGVSLAILVMFLTIKIDIRDLPGKNIIYAYLISTVLLSAYILYDYLRIKNFYKGLKKILDSKSILRNCSNIEKYKTCEQKLFADILKSLHREYTNNIDEHEDIEKQQLLFTNLWVHQMKTPVSVIDLLLQENNSNENKEIFDSIKEENEKLYHGLGIMLYNSRINEFNHDFNVEGIEISSLIRKVINDNKNLFIRSRVYPMVIGKENVIYTDKKWMYFVLNQILVNGIKYTVLTEHEKKYIKFIIKNEGEKIIVIIKDNGIGIPKEDLIRIFNPFFTGKNGRKTSESTGMGLYLAKRICSELGNELSVKSEEGQGAEFYITFNKAKNIFEL